MDCSDSFICGSLYKFWFTSLLQFSHNPVFKQIGVIRPVLVSICEFVYVPKKISVSN